MHSLYLAGIVLVSLVVADTPHLAAQQPTLTIGLIGDSTVADTYGWGPAFAKRFDGHARVLNFAKNGATLDSLSTKLDELLLQKPDYVLIQFGHNDQKRYAPDAYQAKLLSYVQRIQKAGSRPVILSSVTRRNFDADGKIRLAEQGLTADLSVFAQAAGAVAKQHDVPFIDLHSISVAHHNRLGPEASAAYNFNETDRTHFSEFGAVATADLVIEELKTAVPAIGNKLNE